MATTQPCAQASASGGDVTPTGTGPTTNPKMRKRTKTGCLTCRKRRIKCGEERPTCANCIKSKRLCEGYNQRVVFKPPIGDWPNHPGVVSTLQYHNSMLPGSRTAYRPGQPATGPQDVTSIQPRPAPFDFQNMTSPIPRGNQLNHHPALVGDPQPYVQDPTYHQPLQSPLHPPPLQSPHSQLPTPPSASASYFPTQPSPVQTNPQDPYGNGSTAGYQVPPRYSQQGHYQPVAPTTVSHDTHLEQKPVMPSATYPSASQAYQKQAIYHTQHPTSIPEEQNHYYLSSNAPSRSDEYSQYEQRPPLASYGSNPRVPVTQSRPSSVDLDHAASYTRHSAISHADSTHSSFQPVQIPSHDSDVKYVPQHAVLESPIVVSQAQETFEPQLLLSGFGGDDHVSPTQALDEAAVEYQDDDYYDVQSDEDMLDVEEKDDDAMILKKDFSLVQRLHQESTNELNVRSYDAFIYEGILDKYQAEHVANPLKNPKTARVFMHFVHVTGPSLSNYERNPRNPALLFEHPTPPSLQSLWTYTLPLKALNDQALLHAMLALASLHIAKLQDASATPSYKHYAYALKRLFRNLGSAKKRLQVPTIATALLLAFYEVMTAEHVKWSTHLVGAANLLKELDFPSLTQEARRLRAAQRAEEELYAYQNMIIDQRQYDETIIGNAMIPDESLVSTIVGKKVNYDDFGRVFEETGIKQDGGNPSRGKLDLKDFETLQDLYWWYARHDAFQSIISGNPLIMNYHKWSDCPPRSPLARADALYGSHDHIILLIGRIADFTFRDRERKLKQVDANGGEWKPTPGMPGIPMRPPPSQSQGQGGQLPTPTTPMGPPLHLQGMRGQPHAGWPSVSPQKPPQNQEQLQMPRGPTPGEKGPNFFGMTPSQPPVSPPSSYANPNKQTRDTPPTPTTQLPKFADLPAAYEAALDEWNSISHAHATVAQILSSTPAFAPLAPDIVGPGPNMTPFGPALIHRSYDISILWTLLHLSHILLLRSHPAMPPAAMVAASVCAAATAPYATLIGRITAGMQIPMSEDTPLSPSLGATLIESTMSMFFAGVQFQDAGQREWLITRLLEIDKRTGWASAGVIARSCETSWERAAELRKGPPYQRRTNRFHDDSEAPSMSADGSSRGGRGGSGVMQPPSKRGAGGSVYAGSCDKGEEDADTMAGADQANSWHVNERGYVVRHRYGIVPWAMNLLATEEEVRIGMERVGLGGEINVAGTHKEGKGVTWV